MKSFTPSTGQNGITYKATDNTTSVSDLMFTFEKPGTEKTFEFDIENTGSIDAVLLGINGTKDKQEAKLSCESEDSMETGETEEQTICGETGKNDGAVTYKIEYDGKDVTDKGINTQELSDKKLPKTNGTKHVKITVKYDDHNITSTNLPAHKVTVTLPTISFDYGQDESV